MPGWQDLNKDAYLIHTLITGFETELGFQFPLQHNNPTRGTAAITPQSFGSAIGYINRNIDGVNPIVNYFVFNDLLNPELGYRAYFDGPILSQETQKFMDPHWSTKYKPELVQRIATLFILYFRGVGVTDVNSNTILAEADKLATFEWVLAQNQGPGAQEFGDIYNPITVDNATRFYSKISFPSLLTELAKDVTGLRQVITDPDYVLMIQSPDNFLAFLTQFGNRGDYAINDNSIWNYFVYRIINTKFSYLPGQNPPPYYRLHEKPMKPKSAPEPSIKRKEPPIPERHRLLEEAGYTREELLCSLALGNKFTEIHNRLFVEAVFPDVKQREAIRTTIAKYAEAVGVSFRAMIDQLTWLTKESKKVGCLIEVD